MGGTREKKPDIYVPKGNERVVPFSVNGHSGQFVWSDETGMYTMEVNTKSNGELLPHWKLSPALKEHLARQNHREEIPSSGVIYEVNNASDATNHYPPRRRLARLIL